MTQPDSMPGNNNSVLDNQPLDKLVAALGAVELRQLAAEIAALMRADLRRERERLGPMNERRR